ncbi:MAG: glyoxylase-like metal-dependent hydrolase (beta-lactamase superfamily II) [Acidimicrobiales bacterium]|jgi:glyoxylase-like metal-dependent hydrolase (beta-lactamase superfamily II)
MVGVLMLGMLRTLVSKCGKGNEFVKVVRTFLCAPVLMGGRLRAFDGFQPDMAARSVQRLSRRSFLTEFGGGTVAVAIFGLAGCSSGSAGGGANETGGSNPTSGASGASGDLSATSDASATSDSSAASGAAPAPGSLAWQRVNLGFVSAFVLARGSELAVVDTGVSGSETEILEAIETLGGSWNDVAHVILTHAHGDHAGSVGAVLDNASGAVGYAGAADVPKIVAPRDITAVNDGDEVFGLQIIGTPGHTLGHISVYDETSRLLLAGDAMNGNDGGITGANAQFSTDMDMANQSIKRLSSRTIDTVLFGHGEPVIEDAQAALVALADSL